MPEKNENIREKVRELRVMGLTYRAIAKTLHISYQRVHQLYSGYAPDLRKKYETYILKRDNFACQWGNVCKGKRVEKRDLVIHHIDGNPENSDYENLITLCKRCHRSYHKIEKLSGYKIYECRECKKFLTIKDGLGRQPKICNDCKKKIKKYWCKRLHLRGCIICGRSNIRHAGHGLCETCYSKKRYHEIPVVKEKLHILTKEWRRKNINKAKEIQKRAHKQWYKKHKKEIIKRAKVKRRLIKLTDPERYEQYLKKVRERGKKRYQRLKADPSKYEQYLKKLREIKKRRYQLKAVVKEVYPKRYKDVLKKLRKKSHRRSEINTI